MRIAIYQPRISYYVGGGEVVPLEMAKNFSLHGHEVTLVTSRHQNGNSEYFDRYLSENPKVVVQYLELPDTLKWIYVEKPGASQLRWELEAVHIGRLAQKFFEKHRFDILNVHYKVDILAANINFPTVMFLHGVPARIEYYDKIWFSFPNVQYISVSEFIGRRWSHLLEDGLKYDTFTNGIDTQTYHPIDCEKDIDVLYFGRLVPVKGISYLIDAAKILKDKGLRFRLVIAGEGIQKESLEGQVEKLKLADCIKFIGYVPQREVLRLYNRAKIFAAPSFDREGILTTLLEASSCGVPVVTTDSCSMPEFIDHGINGLLARPQDAKSLAEELERLLVDDKFRHDLGVEAKRKAGLWTWDIKAANLERYFENAIK